MWESSVLFESGKDLFPADLNGYVSASTCQRVKENVCVWVHGRGQRVEYKM